MLKRKGVWIALIILVILLITYVAGPAPPQPVYHNAWPELPADATELETYISTQQDTLNIRQDNQARIHWQDSLPQLTEYSFVYLHGFAGSYRDGYPLNVALADTFHANLYLARWAGHGLTAPASLTTFTPETAWESAKEALAIGRRIGRKVIVLSTSTGGSLAIKLAATYPDSVYALINISPNIRDDQPGSFLLNSPWGHELAHLVSFGQHRKINHKEPAAAQYWDTLYPAEALINLQVLLETTMLPATYQAIRCPVLTVYYHKNIIEEDQRVEIDLYPSVHEQFATPTAQKHLAAFPTPGTHFIGSDIKSDDYQTALHRMIVFCREVLEMGVDTTDN